MNPIEQWQRSNWYKEMVLQGELHGSSDTTAPRLVVLVRDDILPPLHQGIQAAHSIIHLSQSVKIDPRCYIILLGASDAQIEKKSFKDYKRHNKLSASYADPGLVEPETGKSPVTACAFEPMTAAEVKKYFGGLKRAE